MVSATGVAPNSPAGGLSAASPFTLRARIPSPRTHTGVSDSFQNDSSSYPSPSAFLAKGKSKRKKNKSESGNKGWMRVESDSAEQRIGDTSIRCSRVSNSEKIDLPTRNIHPKAQNPSPSLITSVRAVVETRWSRMSHQQVQVSTGIQAGFYPQKDLHHTTLLSMAHLLPLCTLLPSATPYPHPVIHPMRSILNGWSTLTLSQARMAIREFRYNRVQSEDSMTHFRKYDSLREMYPAFSISSKGGKRHLSDMVSTAPCCRAD